MRVELDDDEVWALLSTIGGQILDGAALADEDRAKLRNWRSAEMRPGREALRTLTEKLNGDLTRSAKSKERSAIQKHDWV